MRIQMRHWLGCAMLFACFAACSALAGELKIEVLPASMHVQVGDPLLLKVRVTNVSPDAAKLPGRISTGSDTLHFDVRGPGESDYQRVISTMSVGLRTPFQWNVNLAPRAAVVSCEALFKADGDRFAFSTPGVYRLRAQVGASEEALGYSHPVEITVSARRDSGGRVEEPSESLVTDGLADGGSVRGESTAYETEAAKLESSQLKTTLLWMAAVARLRDAKERDKQKLARAAFDAMRATTDPVTRDQMTLTLAEAFIWTKAYQAAIVELDAIKDDTTQKADLLYLISEQQREAAAAKARLNPPGK